MAYKSLVYSHEDKRRLMRAKGPLFRFMPGEQNETPEEHANFTVKKILHMLSKMEGKQALGDQLMCKQPGVHI